LDRRSAPRFDVAAAETLEHDLFDALAHVGVYDRAVT